MDTKRFTPAVKPLATTVRSNQRKHSATFLCGTIQGKQRLQPIVQLVPAVVWCKQPAGIVIQRSGAQLGTGTMEVLRLKDGTFAEPIAGGKLMNDTYSDAMSKRGCAPTTCMSGVCVSLSLREFLIPFIYFYFLHAADWQKV